MTGFLSDRFSEARSEAAIIHNHAVVGYDDLTARVVYWGAELNRHGISPGEVVAIVGDYGPNTISLFLALSSLKCVIVPLAASLHEQKIQEFCATAGVGHLFQSRTTNR